MFKSYVTVLLSVCLFPLASQAGDFGAGNGGDAVALEFTAIARNDISQLEKASASLPQGLDLLGLQSAIDKVDVQSQPQLSLQGVEKDALNFPVEKKILVSRTRWLALPNTDNRKETLVIHEYLGILGVDDSKYQVTSNVFRILTGIRLKSLDQEPADSCYEGASGDAEMNLLENARFLRVGCVKDLISQDWFKKYQNINARDAEGKTALSIVSDFGNPGRNETSIHYQDRKNRALRIGMLLVEAGANPDIADKADSTPLMLATYRVPELAKYLVQHGANAKLKNEAGENALHTVTDPELAELLIQHGADVNMSNSQGMTPLVQQTRWAILWEQNNYGPWAEKHPMNISSYTKIMTIFLNHGADINAGKTNPLAEAKRLAKVLHLPVEELQTVKFLIAHGAK